MDDLLKRIQMKHMIEINDAVSVIIKPRPKWWPMWLYKLMLQKLLTIDIKTQLMGAAIKEKAKI